MNPCLCGCGSPAVNKFVSGHNLRVGRGLPRTPERATTYHREYYRANRLKIRDRVKERYRDDPEFKKAQRLNSNAHTWNIVPDEVEAFKALYNEDCFIVAGPADLSTTSRRGLKGGEDRLYNLVPCCLSCNSSKQNKTPGEWYDATGSPL